LPASHFILYSIIHIIQQRAERLPIHFHTSSESTPSITIDLMLLSPGADKRLLDSKQISRCVLRTI